MKKLLTLLFALLIFSSTNAFSDYSILFKIEVGKQPAFVHSDQDGYKFHVICMGYDADFDGIYDEEDGDENPSYWTIDYALTGFGNGEDGVGNPQKIMELPFASLTFPYSPFRPMVKTLDNDQTALYFTVNGKIAELKLVKDETTGHEFTPDMYDFDAKGISGDNIHLFISEVTDDKSELKVYRPSKDETVLTIDAGPRIQMNEMYEANNKHCVAVLNEGDLGSNNSTMQLITFNHQGNDYDNKLIDIGDTGNFFRIVGNKLYAVANGSHNIVVIDLATQEIEAEIPTETEGYNGPREIEYIDELGSGMPSGLNIYAVTTYDSKLLFISQSTGEIRYKIEIPGKCEGLHHSNKGYLAVCNISNADYTPSNLVCFLGNPNGVEDVLESNVSIYPNPAKDEFSIDLTSINQLPNSIKIVDVLGNVVANINSKNINRQPKYSAQELGLNSGFYFAVIEFNSNKISLPLSISK
jgi:Secretion system C-terminal sorting domain